MSTAPSFAQDPASAIRAGRPLPAGHPLDTEKTDAKALDFAISDQPLLVLCPTSNWASLNLRDFWEYRELFLFLTWRDVQVRYKQTVLGALWAIIQPVATMLIFSLFFGKLAQMPSEGIPYSLFAYAGLLPWTFFSNALTSSGNSLVGSSNLITKVYFPRMIIPGAAVAAGLVDFAIAFVILAALMAYHRLVLTWNIVMLLPLIVLTAMLAVGVGMWMSALNVKYRDVRYALPFLIQLWMFASPVIYPASIVPERWRWILAINPLTGIIEGYRAALFGSPFDRPALSMAAVSTLAVLTYSSYDFRRMEKSFADLV